MSLFIRRDLGTTQFICRDKKFFSYYTCYENLTKYPKAMRQADWGKSIEVIFNYNLIICLQRRVLNDLMQKINLLKVPRAEGKFKEQISKFGWPPKLRVRVKVTSDKARDSRV